ncbi:MAG TPA: hypothetical protein PKI11_05270 [Candidatus Hydrogenedentes bacterium]|nr:hypothetical protein [Candidatus Hydrogenedentota bacterium]
MVWDPETHQKIVEHFWKLYEHLLEIHMQLPDLLNDLNYTVRKINALLKEADTIVNHMRRIDKSNSIKSRPPENTATSPRKKRPPRQKRTTPANPARLVILQPTGAGPRDGFHLVIDGGPIVRLTKTVGLFLDILLDGKGVSSDDCLPWKSHHEIKRRLEDLTGTSGGPTWIRRLVHRLRDNLEDGGYAPGLVQASEAHVRFRQKYSC